MALSVSLGKSHDRLACGKLGSLLLVMLSVISCDLFGAFNNPADEHSPNFQGFDVVASVDAVRSFTPAMDADLEIAPSEFIVSKVTGAIAYQLQVSLMEGFFSPMVLDKSDFISNKMASGFTDLSLGYLYYWRARARQSGIWGRWTSVRSFIIMPRYTVRYDGNGSTGGSVPIDSSRYTSGSTVTVLGNTGSLTRTGFNFAGWNTLPDGNGTDRTVSFVMGSSSVILYAKWTAYSVVTNPTFNPVSGIYTNVQTVSIGCTTSGASIRYTIDGSTPTESAGSLYSSAITVGSSQTVKAIAYKSGMTTSLVSSAAYWINGSGGLTITNPWNPTISFSGQQASILYGSGMTVTATVTPVPDSYAWYLDGIQIAGALSATAVLGNSASIGFHILTLLVTKGGSLASEKWEFMVETPPTPVSGSIFEIESGQAYVYGTAETGSNSFLLLYNRDDSLYARKIYVNGSCDAPRLIASYSADQSPRVIDVYQYAPGKFAYTNSRLCTVNNNSGAFYGRFDYQDGFVSSSIHKELRSFGWSCWSSTSFLTNSNTAYFYYSTDGYFTHAAKIISISDTDITNTDIPLSGGNDPSGVFDLSGALIAPDTYLITHSNDGFFSGPEAFQGSAN